MRSLSIALVWLALAGPAVPHDAWPQVPAAKPLPVAELMRQLEAGELHFSRHDFSSPSMPEMCHGTRRISLARSESGGWTVRSAGWHWDEMWREEREFTAQLDAAGMATRFAMTTRKVKEDTKIDPALPEHLRDGRKEVRLELVQEIKVVGDGLVGMISRKQRTLPDGAFGKPEEWPRTYETPPVPSPLIPFLAAKITWKEGDVYECVVAFFGGGASVTRFVAVPSRRPFVRGGTADGAVAVHLESRGIDGWEPRGFLWFDGKGRVARWENELAGTAAEVEQDFPETPRPWAATALLDDARAVYDAWLEGEVDELVNRCEFDAMRARLKAAGHPLAGATDEELADRIRERLKQRGELDFHDTVAARTAFHRLARPEVGEDGGRVRWPGSSDGVMELHRFSHHYWKIRWWKRLIDPVKTDDGK